MKERWERFSKKEKMRRRRIEKSKLELSWGGTEKISGGAEEMNRGTMFISIFKYIYKFWENGGFRREHRRTDQIVRRLG